MHFEQRGAIIEKFGEKAGFLFSFFFFSTILYFILSFLDKLPVSWSYYHIIAITFCIILVGVTIKRLIR